MLSKQLFLILAVAIVITTDAATIRGTLIIKNDGSNDKEERLLKKKKCQNKKNGKFKIKDNTKKWKYKTLYTFSFETIMTTIACLVIDVVFVVTV